MQTFLPYADFAESASVLDQKRLGKQRVETLQIFQALTGRRLVNTSKTIDTGRVRRKKIYIGEDELRAGEEIEEQDFEIIEVPVMKTITLPRSEWRIEHTHVGWDNHPATKMWTQQGAALLDYQTAICNEWTRRGYKDTCLEKTEFIFLDAVNYMEMGLGPKWLGREDIHASHRANLLRKDPEHYGQFGWTEEPMDGYIWPV